VTASRVGVTVVPRSHLARLVRAGPWVALGSLVFFGILFNPYAIVGDDATTFYGFLDRLFGGHAAVVVFDPNHAVVGYYFGLAFLNMPFYALGELLRALGLTHVGTATTTAAAVAAAGTFYMVAAAAVTVRVVRALRLPAAGFAVLVAVVGSPLLYYGVFQPGKTHAAETFVFAAGVLLVIHLCRRPDRWLPLSVALGAVLGLGTATRYEIAGGVAGLLLAMVVSGRRIQALVIGGTAVATFFLLAIAPLSVGAPLFQGSVAGGTKLTLGFAPLTPLRLLFSGDRGIALWTPVMILGAVGFVRLLVVRRGERQMLAQIGAMHLGFFCFFFFVTLWEAGWSFSSRYLTPMLPLVAIGVAELIRWRPRLVPAVAVLGAAWSLYLCLNVGVGIGPFEERAAVWHAAAVPAREHKTAKSYLYEVYAASHLRALFGH
jgi:hypothetical protein